MAGKSFDVIKAARSVTAPSPTAKAVLMALALRADAEGKCNPSIALLCEETQFSDRAVRAAVGDLVRAGLIEKRRRSRRNGGRTSDEYRLLFLGQTAVARDRSEPNGQAAGDAGSNTRRKRQEMPVATPGASGICRRDNRHLPPRQPAGDAYPTTLEGPEEGPEKDQSLFTGDDRPAKNHKRSSRSGGVGSPRASRISRDWQPSQSDLNFAKEEGFSQSEIDRLVKRFRDYYLSAAGPRGVSMDWSATWRRWIRTERDRSPKQKYVGFV